MIKHFYYIRHGQTEANEQGVYTGSLPHIPLTKLGVEQAQAAAKLMSAWGINRIIASDLDRAQHTARIIADGIKLDRQLIVTQPLLREMNVGRMAGTPDEGFPAYLEYAASGVDPEAETIAMVDGRVREFLATLEQYDGETLLVVSHAGVGRVILSILTGEPMSDLARTTIPNCEPIELSLDRIHQEITL